MLNSKLNFKLLISFFIVPILITFGLFSNVNAVAGPPAPMSVTINQESSQADPASVLSATFKVVFSQAITASSFTSADINTSGSTAAGVAVSSITEIAPNDGTTFDVVITSTGPGTIVPTIPVSSFSYGAAVVNTNPFLWNTNATDITLDASGNVYYYATNKDVYKMTPAGVFSLYSTTTGGSPTNGIFDSSGNLYVVNSTGANVTKITPAGVASTYATTGTNPVNLAFDTAGNLYVTNLGSANVTKIPPGGGSQSVFGTTGANPQSIVFDSLGNLYTANNVGNSVTKITPSGVSSTFASVGAGPIGMVIDSSNNLYTANQTAGTISKITPAGVVTTYATLPAGSLPYRLDIDSGGNLFVTTVGTNSVLKVSTGGVVSTVATGVSGAAGIKIDSNGNIYVENFSAHTITKVPYNETAGTISPTGAGNAASTSTDNSVTVNNVVAPTTPSVPDMTAGTDSGSSNTDNITNDSTPDFTGTCVTGETVTIKVDGTAIAPTQVCAGSAYTITPSATISQGNHNITSMSTNVASTNSADSAALAITIDSVNPVPPTCSAVPNPSNLTVPVVITCTGLEIGTTLTSPGTTCTPSPSTSTTGTCTGTSAGAVTGPATTFATQTDVAGNAQGVTFPFVVDTTPPSAPPTPDLVTASDTGSSTFDNYTSDNTPNLAVACTTGETVQLYVDAVAITPTQVCPAGSSVTFTSAVLADGVHNVTATATDAANNTSPQSTTPLAVTIDTSIPAAVTPDMTAATDLGSSSTDNLTSDNTPDFTGACVANDVIQLFVDTVAITPTQVCPAGGVFTITPAVAIADGPHNVTSQITDPAGNVSPVSSLLPIVIDTVPPTTPTCVAVPNPSNQTQIAVITCSGVGIGDTITVPGAVCAPSPAIASGVVNCNENTLTTFAGPTVPVTVTDTAGNTTPVTVPYVVDIIPPAMLAAPDMTAATDTGVSPIDNITNDTTPDFTGTCTPTDTIKMMVDLLPILPTQVCPASGIYLITPTVPLTSALHSITATATDLATNVSPISPALPVTIDTVLPSAPTINPIKSTDLVITGTGDPSDTITLTGATCTNAPVIVSGTGTWSCTIAAPLPSGTLVTAIQTDVAGNPSLPVTTKVYDPATTSATPTINPINNLDTVISGTAVPGATVNVSPATCTNAPIIANGAGMWSCKITTPLATGTVVTATATEPGKTVSPPATTKVSDALTTSPSAPVLNPTDGSPITGTGEPGDIVTVKDPTNTTICTALVQADGTWSCTPAVIPPNGTIITATQTDPQGNVSGPASIKVDSSAPSAPTIDPIKSIDPVVTGNGEPGDLITLTGATCTNNPIYVNAKGEWSCTLTSPLQGGTVVTAVATDPAGNVSTPTSTTVYNPATKSAPPEINPINTLDKVITGTSVIGSTITLTNATCTNAPIITNGAGMWTCKLSTPLLVNTIVTATSTEPGKTVSDPSTTKVSDASITSPSAPTVNPTDGSPISGTGEPGATVTVTDPTGAVVCTAVVQADGTWSCTPATIPPNGTELQVTQTDPQGNVSPPAYVKVDQTPGSSPTIDPIKTTDTVITGTGEPGDTVNVSPATCTNALVIVAADGSWVCTIATPLTEGTIVTATLTDPAGNVSNPATTTVYNPTLTSQPPTINPINNLDKVITGSGVPGATITLSGATCTNSPVIVNPAGTWVCKLAATLPVGTVVSATATEPGKNGSTPASTKVSDASTTAPSAPVVNPTDGSPISGTGEPGDTITVKDPTGAVVCTTTVQADGTWSCTPSTIPPAGTELTVTQTDTDGNVSPPTHIKVDGYAPASPTINPIKTTDTVVTGTGEPGATITLTNASCTNNPIIVALDGTWTCNLTETLQEGIVVTATLTDPAGNTSAPASTTVYDPNNVSTPPVVNPINDLDKVITGTGTPGATIDLGEIKCTNLPIIVDAFGNWICKLTTPLPAGTVVIATATEPGRTPSGKVKQQVVLSATTSPSAPIVYPTMGFEVTGTGEPGAVVTVKDSKGNILCSTTVQMDGTWSCTLEPSQPNGAVLTVTQMDSEGNISPPAHVKVDRTAPPAPTIDPFSSTDGVITGTGEPGNIIKVTGVSCTNNPIVVDLKGKWKCILALPIQSGLTITVTQTDPAGNVSAPVTLSASDDLDGDGVSDAVEKGAPNGGDGNGDGIKDYLQANVLSVLNAYSTAYITLELPSTGDCSKLVNYSVNKENQIAKQDSAYDYPVGLLNFKLKCSGVATIKQFWYGLQLTTTFIARKYQTTTGAYKTLSNVNISKTASSLVFNYQIQEGSSLDDSPAGDGYVVDPIGPAVPAATTANTGADYGLMIVGLVMIVGMSTVVMKKYYFN